MSPRIVTFLLFAVVLAVTCSIQTATAFSGRVLTYKEVDFKRLQRTIRVSASNLCYDMPCTSPSDITMSAKWKGLPATGKAFPDGHAIISFYTGNNCTGSAFLVPTSDGQIGNLGHLREWGTITSIAVLQTSRKTMEHPTMNLCY